MKYRTFGRTGLKVSIFGFGGIVVMGKEQKEANKYVAEAVERGVNLFDVGPTYGDAQEKLGPALKPFRDEVVLTCKTEPEQSKKKVWADIKDSLEKLKTDYLDVYQLHEVTEKEAMEKALAPGGALEAIEEAKDEGLIKYVGFSSHGQDFALDLMEAYDFDTVMFPINWNNWFNAGEGKKVIARARETNKGIMAIKALAHRQWKDDDDRNDYNVWYKPLFDNDELAELALRFSLTRDIDSAISPGDIRMLNKGLDIVEKYEDNLELSAAEKEKLQEYVEKVDTALY
ncbi:MAG: aldo/keto reductase [Halanaerobiaceae bacterium]